MAGQRLWRWKHSNFGGIQLRQKFAVRIGNEEHGVDQGAIEMAQTQLADGRDPQAIELAQKIIADQEAEIEEMQGLLASA